MVKYNGSEGEETVFGPFLEQVIYRMRGEIFTERNLQFCPERVFFKVFQNCCALVQRSFSKMLRNIQWQQTQLCHFVAKAVHANRMIRMGKDKMTRPLQKLPDVAAYRF